MPHPHHLILREAREIILEALTGEEFKSGFAAEAAALKLLGVKTTPHIGLSTCGNSGCCQETIYVLERVEDV